MNIDLRNISEEFENQVNQIKKDFLISTNSKAVEYCTLNYLQKLDEIEKLKQELKETKQSLGNVRYHLGRLQMSMHALFDKSWQTSSNK